MLLSVIQARLEGTVQSYCSVPTTAQYKQAVKDAIDAFSIKHPLVDTTTLELVEDTAAYDLPDDFVEAIRVRAPTATDYRDEEWEILGSTIVFFPTPSFDHDYTLRYCAKYAGVASDSDMEYADIGDTEARIVLFEAEALCLQMMAQHTRRTAWQYQEGEQAVNMTKLADNFQKSADQAHETYLEQLEDLPVKARVGLTQQSETGD